MVQRPCLKLLSELLAYESQAYRRLIPQNIIMGGIKREMYVNGETKIIVKIGHPDVLKLRRTRYVHLVPLFRQEIPHESRIPCLDIGEW